ncbi:hypothetical protein [Methylobacterium sp. Leaf125]|uniref:hypothetical protein n=1 Tax=Methylobacterium sp. Leaf125 TaxID=1736265 RepID=UPI000A500074|nr:hypothetical protein [Methylobacterium sp. Leaf125]
MTPLDAKRLEIAELIAIELGFDDLDGMSAADRAMVDQHTDDTIAGCEAYLEHPADGNHSNIWLRQLLKQYLLLFNMKMYQINNRHG